MATGKWSDAVDDEVNDAVNDNQDNVQVDADNEGFTPVTSTKKKAHQKKSNACKSLLPEDVWEKDLWTVQWPFAATADEIYLVAVVKGFLVPASLVPSEEKRRVNVHRLVAPTTANGLDRTVLFKCDKALSIHSERWIPQVKFLKYQGTLDDLDFQFLGGATWDANTKRR